MKSFTNLFCQEQFKTAGFITIIAMVFSFPSSAQFRTYNKVFSDNIKGGTTIFGNTLTHIIANGVVDTAKMNNNRADGNSTYGNDNSNIQYADVDGSTGAGAGTRNSSSADLNLPAGTNTIRLARLYWGGRVRRSDYNLALDSNKRIKIRYADGAYSQYAASQLDKNTTGTGNSTVNQYQAYVDITSLVQANGSGTYTVGNAPVSTGAVGGGGNYGGWCIVVVYENLSMPDFNSVRVYDGFEQVYDGGAVQITSATLTGLNVPSGTINLRDAKMGAMVWEGDANLRQDYLKINGTNFYNELNAIDNPWNGTITDTGTHVTTKNPNYTNQMGLDIDQFYVGTGYGIQPGDTSVTLEFGTEADQYFPGLFTFQIKTNDPTIVLDKTVKDANNNRVAEPNEILTYSLKGKNIGVGNANLCFVTDTLPSTVTYIPGSMKVVSGTGFTAGASITDVSGDDQGEYIADNHVIVFRVGSGSDALTGGTLAPQESFEIEFKVTVNAPPIGSSVPPIVNVARITGYSDANVKSTDDGTAILEPQGGPLPVTLTKFVANLFEANLVMVNWNTSMEINCSKYEVERSLDARSFKTVISITGAGNSSIQRNYSITDDISGVSSSVVYYRLKQVDFDGKNSYSKVISVRLKNANTDFTVSPNPFTNYVNINIEWAKNENTTVKVFNMAGTEIVSKNILMNKGTNYVSISELSTLPSGNYVVQFTTQDGKIFKQITKQ